MYNHLISIARHACKQTGVKTALDIYYYSNTALAHQPTFPPVVLLGGTLSMLNLALQHHQKVATHLLRGEQ